MRFANWTFIDWLIWATLVFTFLTLVGIAILAIMNKGKHEIELVKLKTANKDLAAANARLQRYINERDGQAWAPIETEEVATVINGNTGDAMIFMMPIDEKPSGHLIVPMDTPKFQTGRHRVE